MTDHAPASDPPESPGLNLNKIIAGAGAAATTAVAGSFFGAAGTVLGAALGSVVSTLATAVYQHSLDRTRDRVKVLIPLPAGRTAMLLPAAPARSRRRWPALVALTVGVFLVGLLAVTGVELLKGSTLTRADSGTSIGRVVDPAPAPAGTTEPTRPTGTGPTARTETAVPTGTSVTPTTEPTSEVTATTSATEEPDDGVGRGAGNAGDTPQDSSAGGEAGPGTTPAATPTPTRDAASD